MDGSPLPLRPLPQRYPPSSPNGSLTRAFACCLAPRLLFQTSPFTMAKKKSKSEARADKTASEAALAGPSIRSTTGTASRKKRRKPQSLNMARRGNKSKRNAEAGDSSQVSTAITKYNMDLSKQRLEQKGFHPAVTTKSRDELLELGGAMMRRHWHRPTRDQFVKGEADSNSAGFTQPRKLTRVSICALSLLGEGSSAHVHRRRCCFPAIISGQADPTTWRRRRTNWSAFWTRPISEAWCLRSSSPMGTGR